MTHTKSIFLQITIPTKPNVLYSISRPPSVESGVYKFWLHDLDVPRTSTNLSTVFPQCVGYTSSDPHQILPDSKGLEDRKKEKPIVVLLKEVITS